MGRLLPRCAGFAPSLSLPRAAAAARAVCTRAAPRRRAVRAAQAGPGGDGVRVNKCFKSRHSRREADALVDAGRVAVNGVRAAPGARVRPGDAVTLDGEAVEWERLALASDAAGFAYLKLHKPVDVVTTTDAAVENNIIACLRDGGYDGRDRVFAVGRLDEQTSGLILCTSDGALVNAALGGTSTSLKEYVVRTDARVTDEDVQVLRGGVVIKTVAQYAQGRRPLVAPTLPCVVERVLPDDPGDTQLRILLREGRNRQIRKMLVRLGRAPVRRGRAAAVRAPCADVSGDCVCPSPRRAPRARSATTPCARFIAYPSWAFPWTGLRRPAPGRCSTPPRWSSSGNALSKRGKRRAHRRAEDKGTAASAHPSFVNRDGDEARQPYVEVQYVQRRGIAAGGKRTKPLWLPGREQHGRSAGEYKVAGARAKCPAAATEPALASAPAQAARPCFGRVSKSHGSQKAPGPLTPVGRTRSPPRPMTAAGARRR